MTQKNKSLVGGISVLGIAGLICKIVGVLYRIPLANLIGGEGSAIYSQVFSAYNLLLTISSAGIPVAISRMVSHYLTQEDPQNAKRIFRVALVLLGIMGLVLTAVLVLISGQLAGWVGTPDARLGYIAIAPSVFLVCVMSAYRGFMQGRRHMTPTAVSQLIEQVGKVAVALPLAGIGMAQGGVAMGAAGAMLGTSIAEAVALGYMMIRHALVRKEVDKLPQLSAQPALDGKFIAKRLVYIAIPITLGACIVPLAGFIDSAMLVRIMTGIGMGDTEARIRFGLYSTMVLTLINVPTAIAMAMSTNLVPSVAAGMARGDKEYVARESGAGLRLSAVIGFPCSIGMCILAKPILYLLFSGSYTAAQLDLAASLLNISSLTIVLFTLVQATSGILQGIGKQRIPMYTLAAGVLCKIALNYTLVRVPGINIQGAPYASLLCYTVSMIPNIYYVCKHTGYRFDWAGVVLRPAAATAVMGAVVYGIWHFGFGSAWLQKTGMVNRALPVAIGLVAGIVVYFFAAWKLGAILPEDLPARFRRKK